MSIVENLTGNIVGSSRRTLQGLENVRFEDILGPVQVSITA